jgi:hypothetical protein
MGHSRTPTQNTAGDGFPADPIDGYDACGRWVIGPGVGGELASSASLAN